MRNQNSLENYTQEYLDDILVRIAHHSSAIEGNTISLADTISIILYETIPGRANKREFYEIENHKGAFEYVLACVLEHKPLDSEIIRGIHRKLTDRLQYDSGEFKKHGNTILGANFETAAPHRVPALIYQWADNLNYRLETATSEESKIKAILEAHIEFEKIHPFSDGNGRTGRMLMIYSFLSQGIAPVIIDKNNKSDYIRYLNEENVQEFYEFAKLIVEAEQIRGVRFSNKRLTQIDV